MLSKIGIASDQVHPLLLGEKNWVNFGPLTKKFFVSFQPTLSWHCVFCIC